MRSKALLVSNIFATIYAGILLGTFGEVIFSAGGVSGMRTLVRSFALVFELIGSKASSVDFLNIILILLTVNIVTFTLGAVMGWSGYFSKKSGLAKFAAILYLIGTVCFPIYIVFGLPITVIGFIGGGKQKKLDTVLNVENKVAID